MGVSVSCSYVILLTNRGWVGNTCHSTYLRVNISLYICSFIVIFATDTGGPPIHGLGGLKTPKATLDLLLLMDIPNNAIFCSLKFTIATDLLCSKGQKYVMYVRKHLCGY